MKPIPLSILTVVALSLVLSSIVDAATLHVPRDHLTIQACIDAAVDGTDECVVAPGTYRETINFFGKGIAVRSSDGPEVTIIDGTDVGGPVVRCMNHEGPATVLEGFTITGGTGTLLVWGISGGGMLNYESTPTVNRCVFRDNSAEYGAGMANLVHADPTLTECTFSNNQGNHGAGLYNFRSSPKMVDCNFLGNVADGGGGAVVNDTESAPTFTGCGFRENTASLGGAIYNLFHCAPTLTDCTFSENHAFDGGAIYNYWQSQPRLAHVAFLGNTAERDGGAIHVDGGSETLWTDCRFAQNHAGRNGGGLSTTWPFGLPAKRLVDCAFVENTAQRGGAIYNDDGNRQQLTGCSFEGNEALEGGGVFNEGGVQFTATDCTFRQNSADNGGGLYHGGGGSTLTRCTFERNSATDLGGGIFADYTSSAGYEGDRSTVEGRAFADNAAEQKGKAMIGTAGGYPYSTVTTVEASSFLGNRAVRGGAIAQYGGGIAIKRSNLENNTAMEGGALFLGASASEAVSCTFTSNVAELEGGAINVGWGGGLFAGCAFNGNSAQVGGGAILTYNTEPLSVTESLFERNWAGAGGALFIDAIAPTQIQRSTFQGNTAQGGGALAIIDWQHTLLENCVFSGNAADFGGGGAILSFAARFAVRQCTLSGNSAVGGGGAIFHLGEEGTTLSGTILRENGPNPVVVDSGSLTFDYCDVDGTLPPGALDGGNNLALDPMFVRRPRPGLDGEWDGVDDDFGDLRLQADSPCIDAGDATFVTPAGAADLDGHARVLCGPVDIGAYEFGIGDFDCDRTVDLTDFAAWKECMAGPSASSHARQPSPPCAAFDFNVNGVVDLFDFAALQPLLSRS